MGLLSTSSSLTRYRVEGELEDPLMDKVHDALTGHVISDIDENAAERTVGWTSFNEPFVPNFEGSSFSVGPYFLFSMRIDKKAVPAKVVQKYYAIELYKKLKASGREFLSRNEKKMIKDHVVNMLTLRIPATPNIYNILWNYEDKALWLFTNLKSACEDLETLFLVSFQLKLIRLFPYTATEFYADLPGEAYDAFTKLTPSKLME